MKLNIFKSKLDKKIEYYLLLENTLYDFVQIEKNGDVYIYSLKEILPALGFKKKYEKLQIRNKAGSEKSRIQFVPKKGLPSEEDLFNEITLMIKKDFNIDISFILNLKSAAIKKVIKDKKKDIGPLRFKKKPSLAIDALKTYRSSKIILRTDPVNISDNYDYVQKIIEVLKKEGLLVEAINGQTFNVGGLIIKEIDRSYKLGAQAFQAIKNINQMKLLERLQDDTDISFKSARLLQGINKTLTKMDSIN